MDQKEFDQLKGLLEAHNTEALEAAKRMDRIENKLDELTSAVVAIARAEEKIARLIEDIGIVKDRLNEGATKIRALEITNATNQSNINSITKFFWIVMTAAVTVTISAIAVGIGFFK